MMSCLALMEGRAVRRSPQEPPFLPPAMGSSHLAPLWVPLWDSASMSSQNLSGPRRLGCWLLLLLRSACCPTSKHSGGHSRLISSITLAISLTNLPNLGSLSRGIHFPLTCSQIWEADIPLTPAPREDDHSWNIYSGLRAQASVCRGETRTPETPLWGPAVMWCSPLGPLAKGGAHRISAGSVCPGDRKPSSRTQACRLHPGPHLHFNTMLFFDSTMELGVRCVSGVDSPGQLTRSIEPERNQCVLTQIFERPPFSIASKIGLPAVPAGRLFWHLVRALLMCFSNFNLLQLVS